MATNTEVTTENSPKRILYVITKANWGGAQRYVFDVAVASKDAGHEVLVVSGVEGDLTERLREAGIKTEIISAMKRDIALMSEIRSFRALLTVLRAFKPDIVHGNSSKAGGLAALAGRLAGVRRILFTSHGWAFNEQRPLWQKVVIGAFHYATVLLAHRTICVSSALRQDAAWMPLVSKRFFVVHNGVSPVELLSRSDARMRLAPDLARSFPTAFWIGTIAELHPSKGLDTLVEAFAAIAHELPVVLVIIGEGTEWAKLQKLVQIYDLPDRVVLTGFVKDASTHLQALDVFVLPSRTESLGYVLLEAGLASLPAIGTRVGGIPEVLEDGGTGLLVPPSKSIILSQALTELLTDEPLRNRLGTALHGKVEKDFSVSAMTKKTLALY
ncbi:MAG: glycosyltransferase [Patescibacteria group bacterium]